MENINKVNVRFTDEQKAAINGGTKGFLLSVGKAAIVFLSALLGAFLGN